MLYKKNVKIMAMWSGHIHQHFSIILGTGIYTPKMIKICRAVISERRLSVMLTLNSIPHFLNTMKLLMGDTENSPGSNTWTSHRFVVYVRNHSLEWGLLQGREKKSTLRHSAASLAQLWWCILSGLLSLISSLSGSSNYDLYIVLCNFVSFNNKSY